MSVAIYDTKFGYILTFDMLWPQLSPLTPMQKLKLQLSKGYLFACFEMGGCVELS